MSKDLEVSPFGQQFIVIKLVKVIEDLNKQTLAQQRIMIAVE